MMEDQQSLQIYEANLIEDAQAFYQFIHEVILPFEPVGFRAHSIFHKSLIYTACEPLSVTAAPRGFLKSTIFSRYRPLYRLLQAKPPETAQNIDYLLVSKSEDSAKEHLAWIKRQIISNPRVISIYGDQKPEDSRRLPWNQEEITLANGSRCVALGYGSQIRSRHPTDILVDDLEDYDNMGTEHLLTKLKNWFYRTLMGAMIPETKLTVIGTIIEQDSLLAELLDKEEFHGKLWKALNTGEDGTYYSLWSERWPVELLLRRRKILGTHQFEAEYQNNPLGPADPIILREWVKRHNDENLTNLQVVRRYITCDPAFTEERWGDYSAIIVLDELANGLLYERLAWRKKVEAPELRKTLMNFYYHFKSEVPDIRFGIEEVAAQKTLRQMINELDPNIEVIPLRPDKDKVRRLVDVSRYFEAGVISLKTESLVNELLNFPKGDKDRVDALVYGLKLYEREHPIINTGASTEVDIFKQMGQDEIGAYIARVVDGASLNHVPHSYIRRYEEAQAIAELFEDYL